MSPAEPEITQADRTMSRIQAALRDNQTACLAQVVELIREITAEPDSISVHHLAELIERDVAVVAEVLRIANTIGYNPEGVEILTVVQAIQVIGFIKIRNLAMSLLLLQHTGQLTNASEAREMSALAVTCGHLAEVGSERLGLAESGQAFVCAALRRYGELLLTTFLPDDYRRTRQRLTAERSDAPWQEVFGLTPLDLGRRMLEGMTLPQGILATLRELPSTSELQSMPEDEARLAAATDLAVRVTAWVAGESAPGDSVESLAKSLTKRYARWLDLREGLLQEILAEVDRRLSFLRGPLGCLPVLDRVRAAAVDGTLPPRSERGGPPNAMVDGRIARAGGRGAQTGKVDASRVLMEGISEISDLLGTTPVRGAQVFMAGARRVMTALCLVDCWVFRRHTAEAKLVPFLGTGPLFPQLPVTAHINPSERSVFTVCVQRSETVLISRPEDPKIRPFLPSWLASLTGTAPLVLLPVGQAGAVVAVLCGVGERRQLEVLPTNVRQQLQVLAKLMALAKDA